MVQLYMSKQMDAKGMLTNEQYELARILYMQWLRKANNIVQLPRRESSPRKKQQLGGPSPFHGASFVEGLEGSPRARTQNDGFDPVTDDGSLLNEFAMMWELRERVPLHFIVFKLTACTHLSHEANVHQVFSRAGNLSDPNVDPECLAHLFMVGIHKKSYKPSTANVKDKHYELFRGQGGKGLERNEGMEEES
jgi:hypothetical protein